MNVRRHLLVGGVIVACASGAALADHCTEPGCDGPDLNRDCLVDLADLSLLLSHFGSPGDPNDGDIDGDGGVNLADLGIILQAYGRDCGDVIDPNTPDTSTANLTAYRPQHGGGYAPFLRTAVAEPSEEDPAFGPGIRINLPGDSDPAGEDDLIEVTISVSPADVDFALRRSGPELAVWTTRTKTGGTQIPFAGDRTAALPLNGQTTLTVWVEWVATAHGTTTLAIERLDNGTIKDALTFHTFRSVVMALGGEGQIPSDPADPESGTFVVAVDLYALGYDVHMYDEDNVGSDGAGAVYNEVVTAVQSRGVEQVAIFGYSHGGGSTYHLAQRLDNNRAGIGLFDIAYTSYVDSVRNNSDIDTAQELRRPPASAFHENHYQHGTLSDFFLDGGPVTNSNPPPSGLDVETTAWGATSTHFDVDDYVQVRDAILSELLPRVVR